MQSIRWRLPLGIAAVVSITLMLATAIGWRAVHSAERLAADERLAGVGQRLADLLGTSAVSLRSRMDSLAADPGLAAALRRRPADALPVLAEAREGIPQALALELWSAAGDLVARESVPAAPPPAPPPPWSPDPQIGGFAVTDTLLWYSLAAAVAPAGDTIGWLVERRRIGGGAGGATIRALIGPDASFLVGDPAGQWTDLDRLVPAPAPAADGGGPGAVTVSGPEGERLGIGLSVDNTPWRVWVSLPGRVVFARSEQFLQTMLLVGALLTGVGAAAGLALSLRITRPLDALTTAARELAAGSTESRVPETGPREIVVLGTAFNRMASDIMAARNRLEEQVAARTRELRDAQQALVRKERLAVLGTLASGVGHELRNPLGVMTNAVYVLTARLTDAPAPVTDYLKILREQIGAADKIVADLLNYARVHPPTEEAFAIAEVVETQLRRLPPSPGVSVRLAIPEGLPDARGDPGQVGQIIMNLLTNAIQAMEAEGGDLRVTATVLDGDRLRVLVSDTGPGVPAADRERIFEPLFTSKARGIGLGLALARNLAEANSAELAVEDTPGGGATFRLELCAAHAREPA